MNHELTGLVAIVTGLPAGLELAKEAIDADLRRRQQGYGRSPRQKLESDEVEVLTTAPGTFAFTRGDLVCVVNCGSRASRLPEVAGELLISSGADPVDGRIAPDTAAWFRTRRAG